VRRSLVPRTHLYSTLHNLLPLWHFSSLNLTAVWLEILSYCQKIMSTQCLSVMKFLC